jgi:hypothetical protein
MSRARVKFAARWLLLVWWCLHALEAAAIVVSTPQQLEEALREATAPGKRTQVVFDTILSLNDTAWSSLEVEGEVVLTARSGGALDLAHGRSGVLTIRCGGGDWVCARRFLMMGGWLLRTAAAALGATV